MNDNRNIQYFTLPCQSIVDWASFHSLCKEAFSFPDYYGHNMDAWIDCMSDIGVSDALVVIRLENSKDFSSRLPQIWSALIECTAFVNQRFADMPFLTIMPI